RAHDGARDDAYARARRSVPARRIVVAGASSFEVQIYGGLTMLKHIAAAIAVACILGSNAHAQTAVRVGSKIDTEGSVLGNMIVQVLEFNGIKTENKVQLGTTKIMRGAITAGEIDIYPEYTGNGAFFFSAETDPAWKNAKAGYEKVKALDFEKNRIVWLEPAPANNTWAIAVRKDVAPGNKTKSPPAPR